ncbi:MAG: thioredoxin domain-containing protein [Leptospiraceae bacterium]|nr:thioredoxin domain-containing protein [Leptospiraceae bacterium]
MSNSRTPNQLIHEKSPYLLQHAYNPVNWFSWSEEAFNKAKSEDKLVLLSIGYATCHWCHVMERESFEDESTAEVLNKYFISIKVDREERPDIDKIYMDALHAMDIQGGWPLNMFLTPDKKPIAGGTYFPPKDLYGRKSFKEVLRVIQTAWETRREEIIQSSESIANYLKSESNAPEEMRLPNSECFSKGVKQYEAYFDSVYYGFKTNMTNKFPPSMGISFLLHHAKLTKEENALYMSKQTLVAMKKGGIYDQIGGGLSRYSTDHRWLVPHFEKMLYDNSLYLLALAECYALTKEDFFKEAGLDIISYIERDMRLDVGGIASAEDADSEGEEGKFYVWGLEEFREVLGDDSKLFEEFWNITEEGNFEEKNIPNESFKVDFPKEKNIPIDVWKSKVSEARKKLLSRRDTRKRPLRDDKILVSWNSLYIRALAYSARVFSEPSLTKKAIQTYDFIYKNLFDTEGRLLRRYREGEARFKAYLTDYAELAFASIALYELTLDVSYIHNAKNLTSEVTRLFSSELGPFYETGTDGEELIRRSFDGYDGVEPSGNSSITNVFLTLAALGISINENINYALDIFAFYHNELETRAVSYSSLLKAYYRHAIGIKEIAVVGEESSKEFQEVTEFLKTNYLPEVVYTISTKTDLDKNSKLIPLLENRNMDKELAIFICKEGVCELPIYSLEELKVKLGVS